MESPSIISTFHRSLISNLESIAYLPLASGDDMQSRSGRDKVFVAGIQGELADPVGGVGNNFLEIVASVDDRFRYEKGHERIGKGLGERGVRKELAGNDAELAALGGRGDRDCPANRGGTGIRCNRLSQCSVDGFGACATSWAAKTNDGTGVVVLGEVGSGADGTDVACNNVDLALGTRIFQNGMLLNRE